MRPVSGRHETGALLPGLTFLTLIAFVVCLALLLDMRRRMNRLERTVRHLKQRDEDRAVRPALPTQPLERAPPTQPRPPQQEQLPPPVQQPPPPMAVPAPKAAPPEPARPAAAQPEAMPVHERVAEVPEESVPEPGEELVTEPPAEPALPGTPPPAAPATPEPAVEPTPTPERSLPPPPPPPPPPARPPEERRVAARLPVAFDLESFLGGRVFLVAGVIAVLLALGFFLKYAFDNEIIKEGGRIALGTAAGLAALIGGYVLHGRGHRLFGHGLMGGGIGALYLSVFFATGRYHLVGAEVGFGITALITAAAATLAIRKNGAYLAWLGFLGAFMAPAILGSGKDALEGLAGWLVLLDLGILAVTWKRRWPGLDLLALAASTIYFGAWYDQFMAPPRLNAAVAVLSVRLLSLHAVALLPSVLTGRRPLATGYATVALSAALSVGVAHDMLFPLHRYPFAAGIAALGLLYAGAGWMRSTHPEAEPHEGSTLYALAVAALATFIPVLLSGRAVPPAWGFAGAAIVFVGARAGRNLLIAGGFLMICLGLGALVFEFPMHTAAFAPFVNGDFLAFAAPFVALAAAGWVLVRETELGKRAGRAVIVVAAWLGCPLIPLELVFHFDLSKAAYDGKVHELGFGTIALALAAYVAALGWFARRDGAGWKVLPMGPLAGAVIAALLAAFFGHEDAFTPFLNIVFAGELAVALAVVFVGWRVEGVLGRLLIVLAAWLGTVLIAMEWISHFDHSAATYDGPTHELLYGLTTLSLAAYAAFLGGLTLRAEGAWKAVAIVPVGAALVAALMSMFLGHEHAFRPFMNLVFVGEFAAVGATVFVGWTLGVNLRRGLVIVAGWTGCLMIAMEWVRHFDYSAAAYQQPVHGLRIASVTLSLAVCAAGLGWFARRPDPLWKMLPAAPLAAGVIAALMSVFFGHDHAFTLVVNLVFAGEVATVGALVLVAWRVGGIERNALLLIALVLLLFVITGEIHAYGRLQEVEPGGREAAQFRAQVGISFAWALYAAGVLTLGFARKVRELRWCGLAVFLLTLAKVVFFDMAELDTLYRIGSFLGLGLLMVGASFLYLRLSKVDGPAGAADRTDELQPPE